MKTGITGLPRCGKTTIFEALTQSEPDPARKGEARVGTIKVPDERLEVLTGMYHPQKTVYAQVEYFLPGGAGGKKDGLQARLNQVRDCDALIHVVRNFGGYGFEPPTPEADYRQMEAELILADQVVAENVLERREKEFTKAKKGDPEEIALLRETLACLEAETPLRQRPELAGAPQLRSYAFLSAKPCLILFNNEDEDDASPAGDFPALGEEGMVVRGKLETELAQMSPDEAAEFLAEYDIAAPAMDRVIKRSYDLLGLISFFTVGEDEVRAWTVKKDSPAVEAAGAVHTDMKKGFIRAEVVSYADLTGAGGYQEARKLGAVRLEGKTYEVQDGDVITFRFNV